MKVKITIPQPIQSSVICGRNNKWPCMPAIIAEKTSREIENNNIAMSNNFILLMNEYTGMRHLPTRL